MQVFDRSQLYTPDDLRADNNASADAALRDIVFPGGLGSWPTIGDLRDRIIFMADPDYLTIAQAQYVQPTYLHMTCHAELHHWCSKHLHFKHLPRIGVQTLDFANLTSVLSLEIFLRSNLVRAWTCRFPNSTQHAAVAVQ